MSFLNKPLWDNDQNRFILRSPKIFFDFDKWEKILLVIGIVLLVVRFIYYPPVFHDEAIRMLKIQQHSFWDLIRLPRLDTVHDGRGFLALVKIFSLYFPTHELSFRLPIFLCSLMGIFLFFRLSRRFLAPTGQMVARGLYITCPFLIQYSSEMRPYASDVLLSILGLFMFLHLAASDLKSLKDRLGYVLIGGLAVSISLPAVLTLSAGVLALFGPMLICRQTEKIKRFLFVIVFWCGIWLLYYFFYIRYFMQWDGLVDEWDQYLFPHRSHLDWIIFWSLRQLTGMFSNPVGVLPWVGLPLWLLGISSLYREERFKLFLLILPFGMTLIAVFMRRYPFQGRVLAFLLPMHLILIGRGYQFFCETIQKAQRYRWPAILLGCLLFYAPINGTIRQFELSHFNSGVSSVLDRIKANWQKGDGIYILWDYRHEFRFLNQRYQIDFPNYVQGKCGECGVYFKKEMSSLLKYRRIWFLLGGMHDRWNKRILFFANHQGRLVRTHRTQWYHLYLYEWDLSDELPD